MNKLITALEKLTEQPIENQYVIIKRFYNWLTVFTAKLPNSRHEQAKKEFERMIGICKLTNKSLGEQVAYELQHPNEFLLANYKPFLETAMYLVGLKEEDIPVLKEIKSEEVAYNEMLCLFISLQQEDH